MHYDDEGLLRLSLRPDFPNSLDDIVGRDIPLLSLHVVTFKDATLVGLSWSHLVTDVSGVGPLLVSWSMVMKGLEAEIPQVVNTDKDMVAEVDRMMQQEEEEGTRKRVKPEDILMSKEQMGMLGMGKVVGKIAWGIVTKAKWEQKLIYLPARHKDKLVERIKMESEEVKMKRGMEKSSTYISTGDALGGWFLKILSLFISSKHVSITPFVNIRYRFPHLRNSIEPFTKSSCVYLQNMVVPGQVRHSINGLKKSSAGEMALDTRLRTLEQTEPSQLIAFIRSVTQNIAPGKGPLSLYGGPSDTRLIVNNLIGLDLIKSIDFGPAVIKGTGESEATRRNPPGTMMCLVLYRFVRQVETGIYPLFLLGQDSSGGHFILSRMPLKEWEVFERELKALDATVSSEPVKS